jgi:hypothetical protein
MAEPSAISVEPTASMPKDTCFVIMPFGPPFDRYYKNIFVPAIEDAGLQPIRADSIFMPSAIMPDIWRFLSEAKILIADLTGRNPNVFYELGLAHALQKPVILVANNLDDVPFDLRGLRVLAYDKENEDWGAELRRMIAASLKETLSDPARATPSTFVERRTSELQRVDPLQTLLRQLTEEVRAMRRQADSHDSGRKRFVNSEGEELEQFTRTVIRLGIFDDFPEVYDELKFRIVIWLARGQTNSARDALLAVSSKSHTDQDALLLRISDLVDRLYRP